MGAALTGPPGGFGLQVSHEERQPWAKHFRQTLARLREVIDAGPPAAVVSVALREQLQWPAEHATSEIHQASREVLAMLPRGPEYQLARALHGGPIDPPADAATPVDYLDRHRANEQFLSGCAAIAADCPAHEVLALIHRLLHHLPHPFRT